MIPDHDANVFITPAAAPAHPPPPLLLTATASANSTVSVGWGDWIVECLLSGLAKWDAHYFLHIATYGYSYEQTLAFYPLFPLIVGVTARLGQVVLPVLSLYHCALIAGTVLNVMFFTKAAECLYELSLRLTGNKKWAKLVAILFCLNPASIFFSASYSEALFAWLSFKVMLEVGDAGQVPPQRVAIPLGLSLVTRSNGMLNMGYVVFFALKALVMQPKKVNKLSIVTRTATIVLSSLVPYAVMQLYFYSLFCTSHPIAHDPLVVEYGRRHDFILAGQGNESSSEWCQYRVPISYSYIQRHYWNVGFMRYYQWRQLPNFLLAAPVITMIMYFCFKYVKTHAHYCLHLGLFDNKATLKKMTLFERQIFPFVIHGAFLTLFCIFFVHIQVSTRLLVSSSPLLYWLCANHFKDATINGFEDIRDIILLDKSEARRLILCYYVGYAVVGTVLFSNFLPWT